jgi:hypothetical protein
MRPRPPAHLTGVEGALAGLKFEPAPELLAWLTATFIADDGPLNNPEHSHLAMATIGVLWTNAANSRLGRRVVGQAEFKPPGGTMGKWARARAQAQIIGWFGGLPDFLITFDAEYAAACSDPAFCALCEHELSHCGQARDEFGMPKFVHETGMPVFAMRGHDVEEFIGVVARYGALMPEVAKLIEVAKNAPEIGEERIAIACGSCRR